MELKKRSSLLTFGPDCIIYSKLKTERNNEMTLWQFRAASWLVQPRHLCLTCTEVNAVITSPGSSIFPVCPFFQPVQLPPLPQFRMGIGGLKALALGTLSLQLHCCWHFWSLYQLPTSKYLIISCKPDCEVALKAVFEISSIAFLIFCLLTLNLTLAYPFVSL